MTIRRGIAIQFITEYQRNKLRHEQQADLPANERDVLECWNETSWNKQLGQMNLFKAQREERLTTSFNPEHSQFLPRPETMQACDIFARQSKTKQEQLLDAPQCMIRERTTETPGPSKTASYRQI